MKGRRKMNDRKIYKTPDKKICGVCGGLADYFNLDPTLIRLATFILTFFSLGTVILVYLVMAFAIENPPMNYFEIYNNTSKKLTKGQDRKISGVCSGIAQMLNIDAVIIRIAWGVLTVCGAGIPGVITYIVAAYIMPEPDVTVF